MPAVDEVMDTMVTDEVGDQEDVNRLSSWPQSMLGVKVYPLTNSLTLLVDC